jgi:hypothetical protein
MIHVPHIRARASNWPLRARDKGASAASRRGRRYSRVQARAGSGRARATRHRLYSRAPHGGTAAASDHPGAVFASGGRVPPHHGRGLFHREGPSGCNRESRSGARSVPGVRPDHDVHRAILTRPASRPAHARGCSCPRSHHETSQGQVTPSRCSRTFTMISLIKTADARLPLQIEVVARTSAPARDIPSDPSGICRAKRARTAPG